MPQRIAAIRSVSQAYEATKEISSQGVERGEGHRFYSRISLKEFLEGRMKANIDSYLGDLTSCTEEEDRGHDSYSPRLLTEMGDVELEPSAGGCGWRWG